MRILIDDDPVSKGLDVKDFDIVATTFLAGIHLITFLVKERYEMYFDHDLNSLDPKWTGYELLKIMFGHKTFPEKIVLITNNSVGRQNMHNLLKEYGYSHKGDYEYLKKEVQI